MRTFLMIRWIVRYQAHCMHTASTPALILPKSEFRAARSIWDVESCERNLGTLPLLADCVALQRNLEIVSWILHRALQT